MASKLSFQQVLQDVFDATESRLQTSTVGGSASADVSRQSPDRVLSDVHDPSTNTLKVISV